MGSLLDSLAGTLRDALSGSGSSSTVQSALGSVLEQSGGGGVQGILDKLHAGGLGDIVSSWTSGGSPQSISTEQLKGALGNDHVMQIANQLGVSPDKALSTLSEHLPGLTAGMTKH